MLHEMRLRDEPFDAIKSGNKKVEIRLMDERRRAIHVGDSVVFSRMDNPNDTMLVRVTDLIAAPTFVELFQIINPHDAGWPSGTTAEEAARDMGRYYSAEEQEHYGVVGIVIELD